MPLERDSNTALSHDAAFELLPWYVNKSLPEAEAATLRAHIAGCEVCHQEIATLNRLHHAILTSEETLAEPSGQLLSQIMERIEDYESESRNAGSSSRPLVANSLPRLLVSSSRLCSISASRAVCRLVTSCRCAHSFCAKQRSY